MLFEIYPLSYLAASNRKQCSSSSNIAGLLIMLYFLILIKLLLPKTFLPHPYSQWRVIYFYSPIPSIGPCPKREPTPPYDYKMAWRQSSHQELFRLVQPKTFHSFDLYPHYSSYRIQNSTRSDHRNKNYTPSSAIVTIRGWILLRTKSMFMLVQVTGLKSSILG